MCFFYWLMNKAILANGTLDERQVGNPSKDTEKTKADSGQILASL